jgi:predicted  nucleic acid-binding Zn-ribbon protein
VPEVSDDVIRELYSVAPEQFVYKRSELADRARKNGDGALATAIDKLRKPTVGAWIVNAMVHHDPSIVESLTDLGDRMRTAQDKLDAGELRELSGERRKLIDKLTADAFKHADRKDPPAALRDEVNGTFDAAIADEDVAARLGRLQRAEQSYGFGFLPTGSPKLTVVRGSKEDKPAPKKSPAKPKVSAAEKRKRERALKTARDAFAKAEQALDDANQAERALNDQVRQLTKRIAKMQGQLDDARAELEQARKDAAAARAERRQARTALDRVERESSSG